MDKTLQFPSTLRSEVAANKPYVKFSIPYDANNVIESDYRSVYLFMPDDVGVTDGTSYEGVDLGANRAIQALSGGGAISDADLAVAGLAVLDMISTPLAKLSPAASIAISNRVAFNPQTAMQFKNTNLREFSFTYVLVPRNQQESAEMTNIENFFRKFLYPAKSGQWSLKYPPLFRVDFMLGTKFNTFYPMYYDSFLTGVTTVMNPNGRANFPNGAPTSMSITLAFAESKQLTRNTLYGDGSGLQYNYGTTGMRPDYSGAALPFDVDEGKKTQQAAANFVTGGETK